MEESGKSGSFHAEEVMSDKDGKGGLRRLVRAIRAPEDRADAPERVVDTLRHAYRERLRNPEMVIHVARVVYDSWDALAAQGLRGSDTWQRHQLYSTAWHDVDLWGERIGGDLWYLIGQILPKDGGPALHPRKALLTSNGQNITTDVPEHGEFHLPSVKAGLYDLRLRLDHAEVVLPGVRVGL